MGRLETDRCKKQEAKGEARPVCFQGSLTASSDGSTSSSASTYFIFVSAFSSLSSNACNCSQWIVCGVFPL